MDRTIFVLLLAISVAMLAAFATAARMNYVSLPFIPDNTSVNAVMSGFGWGDNLNGDTIYWYNTTSHTFPYAKKRSSGLWSGTLETLEPGQGYMLKPVHSAYNLTFVGEVPTGSISVPIVATTGGVRLNLIGWSNVTENCNITAAMAGNGYGDNLNGDTVYWYNASSGGFPYAKKRTNGQWTGTLDCFEPGKGYMFKPVASSYTWTYER